MKWYFILLGYGILSYIITLTLLMYLMKTNKEELNLTGDKKKDKGTLMMLGIWFYGSPITLPISIFLLIKNFIVGIFTGEK